MKDTLEELIQKFINEALIYSNSIPEGDKKKVNNANKKMISLFKKIDSMNGSVKLKKYLNHENDGIKLCVASNIIKRFPDESIKILEEIHKKNNIYSLLAEIGLDLWKRREVNNQ